MGWGSPAPTRPLDRVHAPFRCPSCPVVTDDPSGIDGGAAICNSLGGTSKREPLLFGRVCMYVAAAQWRSRDSCRCALGFAAVLRVQSSRPTGLQLPAAGKPVRWWMASTRLQARIAEGAGAGRRLQATKAIKRQSCGQTHGPCSIGEARHPGVVQFQIR